MFILILSLDEERRVGFKASSLFLRSRNYVPDTSGERGEKLLVPRQEIASGVVLMRDIR